MKPLLYAIPFFLVATIALADDASRNTAALPVLAAQRNTALDTLVGCQVDAGISQKQLTEKLSIVQAELDAANKRIEELKKSAAPDK